MSDPTTRVAEGNAARRTPPEARAARSARHVPPRPPPAATVPRHAPPNQPGTCRGALFAPIYRLARYKSDKSWRASARLVGINANATG
ncbi:hypothetical protein GCM10022255_015300 [Dactylosporangium darangshiense]|uniref:Transposase n=1 Tax=Dactylosporangium darangshiense TaxID=579108 RepID=A0ABP8D1B0_9ACTN